MLRWIVPVLLLGCLAGCARKDLPEVAVRAGSAHDFATFRADLGDRFGAERMQAFDTAIQELKLDAMRRDVAGVEAREQAVLAAVDGKTVREAEILGWKARRARLLAEAGEVTALLERDRRMHDRAATPAAAQSAASRMQSEQDILTRLQGDLAGTEERLKNWGVALEPAPAAKAPGLPAAGRAP